MTQLLAQCQAATRRFGGFVAVDQVDLSLQPGEIVGLLGANGAGKTTVIKMLLGLLPVSGGVVRVLGGPPSRAARRRIGYVPQSLGLYDDLTVAENLAFCAAVFGAAPDAGMTPALRPYGRTLVGDLPLGVQRRVAFAAALQHRPDLLILDEPSSGVDPLARSRLWETIADAAKAGAGVLVTTHYMEEAGECTRLVIMAEGRVVAEGTASEITGGAQVCVVQPDDWTAAFGALEDAGFAVALAGTGLRVSGAAPDEVRHALGAIPAQIGEAPATLEERFFQLTAAAQATP